MTASPAPARPRVTLLVNVVAPYRVPVYRALAEAFELTVCYAGGEDNRTGWDTYPARVGAHAVRRSWGRVFRRDVRATDGSVERTHYLGLTPGYLADLWRSRPDAVVTNEMGLRTVLALAYGALWGVPVWVWWEGTPHTDGAPGALRRALRRLLAPRVARWISLGDAPTAHLAALGVPRERVLQVQNAVDEAAFTAPVAPHLALAPRPVLLCASRLIGVKGVDRLLDAAAELRAEGHAFSVLVVGRGPQRAALEAQIARLGLTDVVRLLAEVPAEAMPAVYRSADLFVLPTLYDQWGLVVNEALWSGVPVLASRYAGCAAELLPPSQLFDPLAPGALAAALRHVLVEGLPPADTSRLMPIAEVGRRIVADVRAVLEARAGHPARAAHAAGAEAADAAGAEAVGA